MSTLTDIIQLIINQSTEIVRLQQVVKEQQQRISELEKP